MRKKKEQKPDQQQLDPSLLPGIEQGGHQEPESNFYPISKFPVGPDGNKKGSFRRSGHLTDQMLKYNYKKDSNGQITIFDELKGATKRLIAGAKEGGIEIVESEIVEGIRLSPSEQKVIDSLCKMLHEKSQNYDSKDLSYYGGNSGAISIPDDTEKGSNTTAPRLSFTLYELTKEYKGGDAVTGKDVENVSNVLQELNRRHFLLRYTEKSTSKSGEWVKTEIEGFRKLISIEKLTVSYGVGDVELSEKTETIVTLNPIFRRQIDTKFILYPNDINRRTAIAYGSEKVSETALRLRDYLMRELSSKRYTPEIGKEKLYYLLAEKWMNESRKKLAKQYTEKAIDTCKALGLLKSYQILPSSDGTDKVIFELNKEWG